MSDLIPEFKKRFMYYVKKCSACGYDINGKSYPFFGEKAKFLIHGEAPHDDEVREKSFFVGKSGKLMWDVFSSFGFKRDDFYIINSVMCKPTVLPSQKNNIGKPTPEAMKKCFVLKSDILKCFYDICGVRHILALGNYAKYVYTGELSGIMDISGTTQEYEILGRKFNITFCIHPASCLYNGGNKGKFNDSIENFVRIIS